MKIRKIIFTNHSIFGDLEIDFTGKDGKAINTIIIAGENGVGKSLLLNMIFEFSRLSPPNQITKEKRTFEIELSNKEIDTLNAGEKIKNYFIPTYNDNNLEISIDYNSDTGNWNQINVQWKTQDKNLPKFPGTIFSHIDSRKFLKTIFSDVEINFTSSAINTVTSKNIDTGNFESEKSRLNIATDIAQLLIDVQSVDALEFTDWARNNPDQPIDHDKIDVRIRRFTTAFHFMFPFKRYKRIENVSNHKRIVFEEKGREMGINELSSGEKQIVFRGSFLLKDKESSKGALILIDEPEISLHPNWQLKVLSFFKKLFTNNEGEQTSQLIIATHSPFILHNANRNEDKVIVLQKDENGKTIILQEPKFITWSSEKIVHEAFNISHVLNKDITVFLEGETDEKYYNKCLQIFDKSALSIEFKWIGRINDKGNAENTGDTALNQAKTFFTANMEQVRNKIILFYDSDTNKPEETIENLLIKKMEINSGNTVFKKGVENLLTLITEIDTSLFYKEREKIDDYNAKSIIRELDKTKLCSFICETLDKEKQRIVLAKLNDEIERIISGK